MRTEHLSDSVTLYLGDCREILPSLPKVDAVVTSPPYGQQRDYGKKIDDWPSIVGSIAHVACVEHTQILINLGLIHRSGEVVEYWEPFKSTMRASGWRFFGWYVWDQMSGMMGDWNGRLAPSFEFVFHFNRQPRVVNKTKPTLGGRLHSGNVRNVDGTSSRKSQDGKAVQPTKIPDSVIRTVRETSSGYEAEHPARFPAAFAKELIAPFSNFGETILDPFMGSGTTGVACVQLDRKFTGIEIEPKYFDIACRRISEELKRPRLPLSEPAKPVVQAALL